MTDRDLPLFVGGRRETPNRDLEVLDKYRSEVAFRVPLADPATIDRAIAAAVAATRPMRELPTWRRREVLEHCVRRFEEQCDDLADVLCVEAGKPIKDARGEVQRLIDTFRFAAMETGRIGGEVVDLDQTPKSERYRGMWKRVPIGPCSFISPFNFPLNLAAHKIAPAIAAGCPFVLKPASLTPVGALRIGAVLEEAGLPEGAFSILPCRRDGADLFTTDERLKFLSFTGSPEVGWQLKAKAGRKKVTLELGGNAACIVDEGSDLEDAVERVVFGAYYQSGQSCISVQRVLVHEDLYGEFRDRLVGAVEGLKAGDPRDEDCFLGPMISESEAERLHGWIRDAVDSGATLLCGGGRDGAMLEGTVLEGVDPAQSVSCEEAFGPVCLLQPYDDFEAALQVVNSSRFGLQAGVFTNDYSRVLRAWDELEVGGVVINDVPSWRVDHMPYGGVKDSGIGREGLRFAIEEMTEIRLLATRCR